MDDNPLLAIQALATVFISEIFINIIKLLNLLNQIKILNHFKFGGQNPDFMFYMCSGLPNTEWGSSFLHEIQWNALFEITFGNKDVIVPTWPHSI